MAAKTSRPAGLPVRTTTRQLTALGLPGLVLRLSETECSVLLLKWYASDESSMQADFGFGFD